MKPKHSVFLDYLQVLQRRKRLILWCLGGVMILTLLVNQLMTPSYEAEATLIYAEPQDARFAMDADQLFFNNSGLVNLAEQLRSRSLAKEVAQALPEEIVRTVRSSTSFLVSFSGDTAIDRRLQKRLTVELVPGADILKIKAEANDPTAARIIANTYAERLIAWNLRKKKADISSVRNFVEDQLKVFQEKLNGAEEALRAFKEKNKMLSLSESATEILRRMTGAEVAYNGSKAENTALVQRQRAIAQKKQELAPSLTITASPRAEELKQQLQELEKQLSTRRVQDGLAENHPELAAQKQKISQIKQQLVQELLQTAQDDNLIDPVSQIKSLLQESINLEVELETNKARQQGLNQVLAGYERELATLPEQELMLTRLVRDREVNDRIYSMLLEKREEVRISEAGKIGDVQIIDAAEEPLEKVRPDKILNFVLGLLLGVTLSVGLAFFLESLDTSLKSREDVEKYVNLPVLASIPSIGSENGKSGNGASSLIKRNQRALTPTAKKLFANLNGHSTHIYEAYRSLLINFSFINTGGILKSLLVTSAGPGEGKTLTAINMAQTFAKSGIKVLLIDGDLRCPTIHKILGIDKEPGLTNVLANQIPASHATQQQPIENLAVMSCGTTFSHPSEILFTNKMRELLAELKREYELIIIDAPPLMAVTDPVILSTEVDGVCLVIKSGKTSHEAALRAKQLLENSHSRIVGTIVNDIDLQSVYGYRDAYQYSGV
jgi:capsular exopolysaccharide synthesis family protein